ncbi:hypothetical protein OHS81_01895 [Streptomyces sp. NBC_00400]|uniref:hypothetical protein n=1 Tax=Streptomyces sp. NBC_00400 TaxID=2975737 RepID=UPI002E1BB55B
MARDKSVTVKVRTFAVSNLREFTPIEISEIAFSRDQRIQGGIELHIGDTLILGRSDTDTIDALWSLILTYIEGFMKDRSGVLNFPERGFMFSLKKMGHGDALVKFTDREDKRAAVGREKDILAALTSGAVEFFSAVLDSSPKDDWSYRRDLNTAQRLYAECSGLQ